MSLISSMFSDPLQFPGTDLLQPFMDLGIDTEQPNRYRHHYHRHRAHHYRRGLGRGRIGENLNLGATTSADILPLLSTLKEDDEKYTLLVDIPGLSKEQCSLRLENDLLTITATPKRKSIDVISESEQQLPYGTVETKERTSTAGEQQQQLQPSEGRLQGSSRSNEKIVWSERPTDPTVRTIPIPVGVDLSKISAKEEHGVLYVMMPKDPNFQTKQARRIEVG